MAHRAPQCRPRPRSGRQRSCCRWNSRPRRRRSSKSIEHSDQPIRFLDDRRQRGAIFLGACIGSRDPRRRGCATGSMASSGHERYCPKPRAGLASTPRCGKASHLSSRRDDRAHSPAPVTESRCSRSPAMSCGRCDMMSTRSSILCATKRPPMCRPARARTETRQARAAISREARDDPRCHGRPEA